MAESQHTPGLTPQTVLSQLPRAVNLTRLSTYKHLNSSSPNMTCRHRHQQTRHIPSGARNSLTPAGNRYSSYRQRSLVLKGLGAKTLSLDLTFT